MTIVFANHRANLKGITTIVVLLSVICPTAMPQANDQKKKVFSLEEAVDFALKNHPSVRASLERVSAAQGGVTLARTNYLPRTDTVCPRASAICDATVRFQIRS